MQVFDPRLTPAPSPLPQVNDGVVDACRAPVSVQGAEAVRQPAPAGSASGQVAAAPPGALPKPKKSVSLAPEVDRQLSARQEARAQRPTTLADVLRDLAKVRPAACAPH